MFFSSKTAAVVLAICWTANALKVTILADTNRDGRVDIEGDTDFSEKKKWTHERGAIFLANIADTKRRCSKKITEDTLDDDLELCHDASDDILRNPLYLAPLVTRPIEGLSEDAVGSVTVVQKMAADRVRIFSREGNNDWVFVDSNYTFAGDELASGLELGIDARDVRRAGGWNGRATVKFTVTDGTDTAEDTVALRVAPVLAHHHGQATERVFVTGPGGDVGGAQDQFVKELKKNSADAGIAAPVYEFQNGDTWTQDFFEPGYTSMPGPDGPIVLRIMVRSAQYRDSGRDVFTRLRGDSVGAVQVLAFGSTLDSTGNLETIPPYTLNGKSYPAGRIIMGSMNGLIPEIFPFLQAQEIQDPLELDTGWLSVGHVDEFLQFLPADTERGWVLMADDPRAGLQLLQDAIMDGHGGDKALSRPGFSYDWGCLPSTDIRGVMAKEDFVEHNEFAASRIDGNLEILKRETGITDDEIFRIPALFYDQAFDCEPGNSTVSMITATKRQPKFGPNIIEAAGQGAIHRRQDNENEVYLSAFYPGIINGVVLSDSVVLAPNPWGPIIDGEDIFAATAVQSYAKASYNVTWQDDWFSHHIGMGEIHCGSNTWRNTDAPWWKRDNF